ncbi:MAG: hypothetical protein DRG58_03860 [Deltaproteobacteria bacterium]|nr:MAG: hypothetical protein DRG58_03860 [Deltaproteobacteria bacterium]
MPKPPAILVVDDEPAITETIQEILIAHGYQASTAKDGLAALEQLEKDRFDMVLIDVVMPEMGGMELLRQISLLYPETMTMMLSGYSSIKDAVAAIKLGAYDYIAKPVHPEALLFTIERALQFKDLRLATRELEWTLKGAEALGLQFLELAPEVEEFKVLEQLRQEAPQVEDWQQLAHLFLEKALDLSQATRGSIFLLQPDQDELTCAAQRGLDTDHNYPSGGSPAEGIMGYVLQHGRPLLVPDITNDPRFYDPHQSQPPRSTSFIAMPVMEEKLWGIINLSDRQDRQPFTSRELFLIWLLARVMAEILSMKKQEEESRRINQVLVDTKSELDQMKGYISHLSKSVTIGLAVIDQDMRLCSTNPAFAKLLNRDESNLIGEEFLPHLKWLSASDRERLAHVLREALCSENSLELDHINLIHPSQGNRFVNIKLVGFCPEPEQPRVLLVLDDITEFEQMRQRLAFSEHLAILGKLSTCVVHELNNPLDGVMRYISLALLKKDDSREVERYLSEAQRGLNRISQSVRSMLNLSQPQPEIKARSTLLNQLREAVKILMFQANDQEVEVTLEMSPGFDNLMVASDFYMVFVNVIKNALNAMPHGGKLQISGVEELGRMFIRFKDNGEGIAPHNLEKIFEPFFTTKKKERGIGLGLAICKKIIERYGGQIKVDSLVGQGTTVTIELPLPVADRCQKL